MYFCFVKGLSDIIQTFTSLQFKQYKSTKWGWYAFGYFGITLLIGQSDMPTIPIYFLPVQPALISDPYISSESASYLVLSSRYDFVPVCRPLGLVHILPPFSYTGCARQE